MANQRIRARHRLFLAPFLMSVAVLGSAVIGVAELARTKTINDAPRAPAEERTDANRQSSNGRTCSEVVILPPEMMRSAMYAVYSDETPDDTPLADRLSLDLSVDWTSAYYFRGIIQETHGVIVQPAVEIGYTVNDNVRVFLGTWNSFHDAATGANTSDRLASHWYECDLYVGASLAIDEWTFTATYIAYLSPSDAFDTIHEIDLSVAYDDSACWGGDFALNPELTIAFETGSAAADGQNHGVYLQLGVAPSFNLPLDDSRTLQLTVPATLGLSLDDYYQDADGRDHTFGFLDAGVDVAYELAPAWAGGEWTVSGGIHVLLFGGATRQFNNGDGTEVIGRIGISASF